MQEKGAAFVAKYHQWLTDEGLLRIQGWARDGLTDIQIAKNMGISYSTFKDWKSKYPALSTALKETKDVVDRQVENALYQNAMNGNITAQIFWLKNRKPKYWRDRVETHEDDDDNVKAFIAEMKR